MTHNTKQFNVTLSIAALTVALAAGCKSKGQDALQDPFFPAQGNVPASKTIFQTQYAAGAAEDAMLFAIHFDGEQLNSLGKQKLDAILAGSSKATPLKLYLNLPKDDAANGARQTNVEAALKAAGLTGEQFALNVGPNPSALRPAAAGVDALGARRLEQGDASVSGTSNNLPVTRE